MRSETELAQLAIDVITNRVFMAQEEDAVMNAFMIPLSIMDAEEKQRITAAKPKAFYEYMDKSGPREVNGYPSFFSMQWLSGEEWEIFWPIYDSKRKALYGDVSQEEPQPAP